jgi:hypothetical protein
LTAVALYWVSLSFGIGMGYHRLLTHRSYKAPKWFEYFLAVCGTLALEGGPIIWVATHRAHHRFADQYGDPHTPREGKWWAHVVWMLVGKACRCDLDVCSRFAPDMVKDRFHVWLSRYNCVPLGAGHSCSGECFSAFLLVCTPHGWSIRPLIFEAAAVLRPPMIHGTTGGLRCRHSARVGTTTITLIRRRPVTVWRGTRSTLRG